MSSREDPGAELSERQALARLEGVVGRLLDRADRLRERTRAAESRVQDVEELLRRFTKGEEDPSSLLDRVRIYESEARDLRERLERGRQGVERLLARIRFLEDQR